MKKAGILKVFICIKAENEMVDYEVEAEATNKFMSISL